MDHLLLTLTYNHSESDGEKTKQINLMTQSTQNHPDGKITKNIKIIITIIDHFYIMLFSALEHSLRSHVILHE